jgi:hypothetical protein
MATKQQVPVLAARLVEFQEEFSILPIDDAQWAIMHGKEAAALCARAISNRQKSILRLISGDHDLKLQASDGSRLIHQAKDTFKADIDSDFANWGINKPGIASAEMSVQVREIIEDCTFVDIFQALPGSWSDKWMPQDKIIDFCETLPTWLRQKGFSTFFLVKKDESRPIDEKKPGDNLAVVGVLVRVDGLSVVVDRLERASVWDGGTRHRVVSPQLMPLEA